MVGELYSKKHSDEVPLLANQPGDKIIKTGAPSNLF
jgi:hypothetical protein